MDESEYAWNVTEKLAQNLWTGLNAISERHEQAAKRSSQLGQSSHLKAFT